jgi:hypothetical protein
LGVGVVHSVLERDLPFAVEDIKQPFLREEVRKSGCCGEREMLKLHAYLMTEYHRVVHLDTDWILLQPIDELLSGSASCVYTEDETLKPRPEVSVVLPFPTAFPVPVGEGRHK